ncbi:hypothetical protein [Aliarcobacter cryaerophilus]|uniref:hypothetical protein n=1 Tax=Aliarcobacter cryaerophilus TaxID=28198 RepID=UPI003DA32593
MNQLTTYQKYIIKRYLLIIFISFLRTFYLNYNIFKMFRNGIEYNEKYQEIKEIQRKNILLNGIELKKWTKLSENQKEYFINNEQTKLEDTSKFKVKYTTKYKKSIIDENNINEQYNFIVFVKTIFQNTLICQHFIGQKKINLTNHF